MNRLAPSIARSGLRRLPGPRPALAPESVRAWRQRKNLRAMGAREVATAAWAKLVFERVFPLFEHVGLHCSLSISTAPSRIPGSSGSTVVGGTGNGAWQAST